MAYPQTNTESQPNGVDNNSTSKGHQETPTTQDLKEKIENTTFPSIIEIKKILPPEVFKPDLKQAFFYVAKDLAICLVLYLSVLLMEYQSSVALRYAFYVFYWFVQGTMMWAIFVLGHDCGHGSFSTNPLLNDTVGTILHTLILVPFYQWKLSHKWHHRNTGNIDKEEIFYPVRESDTKNGNDFKPFKPVFGFGISWFMYLFVGYAPRKISHFNLGEEVFQNHTFGCTASLVSMALMVCCLFRYTFMFGLSALIVHYAIPVLVFASWLVVVTFLHHNEVETPWYADHKWDNVRGQLSTVDRDYGWAHTLTHNIGTHQVHHLFIKIPHYKLEDATAKFRKAFPEHIRSCNKPILSSFFRMFKIFEEQRHIPDGTEYFAYKEKTE